MGSKRFKKSARQKKERYGLYKIKGYFPRGFDHSVGWPEKVERFFPVQSIYADFYIIDDLWPDFKPEHFWQALEWYDQQDVTLGG